MNFGLSIILFINAIANHDWETLRFKCTILLVFYTGVLLAMIVDLIKGLRAAKLNGELRTSYGLRKTVDKAVKYYSLLVLMSIADVFASIAIGLPYFTMIGGLFIIAIEIKSWFEKASDKDRRDISTIANLLRNKDNIVEAFADIIEKETNKKEGAYDNKE